jgi:PAS domain S-box-containing protein
MTQKQEPTYEELKRRLKNAESALRALQDNAELGEGESIADRLAEAEAREAHIKQVLLAVRDVNQLIVREHDRDRLIQGACDLLTETRGYHSAWIALLDEEVRAITVVEAGLGEVFSTLHEGLRRGDQPACMEHALADTGNVVVREPPTDCTYCPVETGRTDLGRLTVALAHEGEIYGSLCATLPATLVSDPEEQSLFQEIAGDLAFALHAIELEDARTRAVQELKASEEMLRLVFENAFDGISIHEEVPNTGARRLINCNERYAEMAGRSKEDLLNAQNTTPLQKKREVPRSAVENRRLREGKIPYRGTFSWIRPDDKENIIEYTAVPIDVNGRPLTIGIDRDITEKVKAMTEREEALDALAESQRQLSILMSNLPGMAYRCLNEPGWPMTFVSEGCRELTGYTPAEMTHSEESLYGNLIHPADQQRVWDAIQEAIQAEESYTLEYRIHNKQGEKRWVWEQGRVVPEKGEVALYLEGFISDITESKQMELQREAALDALRESEEKYRTLFEEALNPILLVDKESRYVDANRAALEFLECERDELLTKRVWDFAHPDTIDRQKQEHSPFIGRRTLETDYFVNGSIKTLLLNVVPLVMDGETILYGIGQDITERKRTEAQRRAALEAVRESETRYRTLFESANDAIFIMEGDTFVNCNAATVRMFGCDEKRDILHHTPVQFSPPTQPDGGDSEQEARANIEAALNGISQHFEWRHTRKDGTPFDTEVSLNRLQIDDTIYLQAIVRDTTERKQAEEERLRLADQVREQARQMEHILETVPAGVLLLDAEGRIVEANPVAKRALTLLADVETGDILTHLGDHTLSELLTSPPTRGLWHEVKAEASPGRTFEVIAKPVANGPDPEQWVLVINEVTREREIQAQLQQQEQLAAVGHLAAGIAHDFNNIMAVIVLYTQMGLRSRDLPARLRERLEVIDQQAKRATDLIQQILDFGGRAMLKRHPMDLVAFLKKTVRLLRRTIPEHITIGLTYEPGTYTVDADPTRMQQMLTNLAINARDAMPDGGDLQIELDRLDLEPGQTPPMPEMKAGPWVRLTVSDTGAGISQKVLPHIFKPFYTTKEPGQGTGLGLAQVHGIVGQHGGAIDVDTEVGSGTAFIVYLPASEGRPPEPHLPDDALPARGEGHTVLVVEDEAMVRSALVESLQAWDYQTVEAVNGKEALALMEAHGDRIDLILSDVVMPEMGGFALFHALQDRGLTLPVVMLSGHPMRNELRDLEAQGLAGWMLKPPEMTALSQLLIRALRGENNTT